MLSSTTAGLWKFLSCVWDRGGQSADFSRVTTSLSTSFRGLQKQENNFALTFDLKPRANGTRLLTVTQALVPMRPPCLPFHSYEAGLPRGTCTS